jgi:hypothetical protein
LGTDDELDVVVLELVGDVPCVVATVGAVVVLSGGVGFGFGGATHAPTTRVTSDETAMTTAAGPRGERAAAGLDITCHL